MILLLLRVSEETLTQLGEEDDTVESEGDDLHNLFRSITMLTTSLMRISSEIVASLILALSGE